MDKTRLHITTRFSAYKHQLMRILCLWVVVLSSFITLHSQCTLACNDQLDVNIGQDGFFVVTLPLLFQGNLANCTNIGVEVYDENFNFIGDTLTCNQVGTVVFARTVNYTTNTYCETDLTVSDITSPQFICPDVFITCTAPAHPDSIGYPSVEDNCTSFLQSDLTYFDQVFDLNCFDSHDGNLVTGRIERTWIVSDDSGNQGSCVQSIYLLRATLNDVIFPAHRNGVAALTCGVDDSNDFTLTGTPLIDGREIAIGGYCEISILYSDQVFNTCGGATTIIRNWLALDACTNSILEFDQIIQLVDNIGPSIVCSADITISANSFTCDADVVLPALSGTDDCSSFTITPSWQFGIGYGPFTDVPAGQHVVTYRAMDACSNTTVCSMTVNIVDNTPPTPICENNISVSLLPSGVARIFASTFDEGSFDNCTLDRIEVRRGSEPFSDYVEFYCADVGSSSSLVQLRAYDDNGLFNDCWIDVTVRDFFGPDLTCPVNTTIDCQDDLDNLTLLGQAIYSDPCGIDTVYYQDTENLICGVGSVQRLWIAVDANGNSSSCQQTIMVEDNSILVISYPDDITIDLCTASLDTVDTGYPTTQGEGCKTILMNSEDQNFFSNTSCYTIFRTWTVINWCVYDPNGGSNTGEYTHVQRIDVVDNTAPVLSCLADTLISNFSNSCSATYVSLSIPAVTDCSGSVTIQNNSPFADSSTDDASGFYPNGIHTIEYTAFDNCGNAITCEQILTVMDGLSPNLICKSGVVVEISQDGSVSIDPDFMVESVSDNCTATNLITYTLTPNTFSCGDIGLQSVELTATDISGNISTCITTIDVQDNMFSCAPSEVSISGRLINVQGTPIENMEVVLNNQLFTTTDVDGNYSFENLPAGEDYYLRVTDVEVVRSGISTFDLVLIAAHLLQNRELTDPYRMIAVDVNNSHSLNVLDMLSIRQLILESVDRFPSDIAWKCVDENFIFSDTLDPFIDDYPEQLTFDQLNSNVSNADFRAIKLGDIDGDGTNLTEGILTQRYSNNTTFQVEDEKLSAGESRDVEFRVDKNMETFGLQFDLLIDPNFIVFEDLTANSKLPISSDNFIYDEQTGRLKFTWNTQVNAQYLDFDQVVFSLKLKAKKDCQLSDVIRFLQKSIAPEIYDSEYEKQSLALSFVGSVQDAEKEHLTMSQNFPNPVVDVTTINIFSKYFRDIQLSFSDANGQIVLTREVALLPGENIVNLHMDEFASSSVLFYSLIMEENIVETKKMIFMVCP